ncbi:MAG TPA: type VI secretion system tube protein Hcp [Verrucomicrobiae bacterium]|nr:type VI secretion system tube protein Hcp [Verrucomicrobiae bacterium]
MASDMFIKINGVNGESKDDKHTKEIDVLAWSFGMSNSGNAHVGGGAGAGKVAIQDLTFTKWVDAASPVLMQSCCNGKHYSDATLVVRKAGEKPLEYIKIKLTDLLITSVSTGGSGGEDRLTESITLNFAKFNYDYVAQKQDGSGESPVTMGWDVAANKKA